MPVRVRRGSGSAHDRRRRTQRRGVRRRVRASKALDGGRSVVIARGGAELAALHLRQSKRGAASTALAVATSCAWPFVATYWRAVGAWRRRHTRS
jgi:hypothetical protein